MTAPDDTCKHRPSTPPARTLPPELKPYRWQPGQSGNPAGRGQALAAQLARTIQSMLAEPASAADKRTHLEAILDTAIRRAKKGDRHAAQLLFDRGFGKAVEIIAVQAEALPAGLSMAAVLSIMRDSGDPLAAEIAGACERAALASGREGEAENRAED